MKPKDFEVIYKFTVASAVPFPSALNWNAEPIGELIRCKDCRWWRSNKKECIEWYDSPYAPADGYCFRAERKEE